MRLLAGQLHHNSNGREGMPMLAPFALEIYRRYLNGESVEELSRELGIPVERIEYRLRAAEAYLTHRDKVAA
jgi:DNA-directed RNA polymerase specialized sigma24 family protein